MRNKQRLLHLYRYLLRYTDDEHQVTTNDLVDFLRGKEAPANRKTVKDDIDMLAEEGIDIVATRNHFNSYFIGNRKFEVPEVKLLADMVTANRSLTSEQKRKLIDKLLATLSLYQEEKLRKSLLPAEGGSGGNERLYYTIDRITEAIDGGKRVWFRYFDASHAVVPMAITCSDNRLFMIGYEADEEEAAPMAFRVERMTGTALLEERGTHRAKEEVRAEREENRQNPGASNHADLEAYLCSLFAMQPGPLTEVVLECDNRLMEAVTEQFGDHAETWKSTPSSFYVRAQVSVSDAFYAWIFGQAGKVRIASPESVAEGYREMIRRVMRQEGKR